MLNPKNMVDLKTNGVNVFIFGDLRMLEKRIKESRHFRPSLTGREVAEE